MSKQLFQTILFRINKIIIIFFYTLEKQIILNSLVLPDSSLVLFESYIGPYQVLPLRGIGNQREMAIRGYSAFPKAPALLEPHHKIV